MPLRQCIRGAVCACGILLGILIIAGILTIVLPELGDSSGAQGAKGVAIVAAACWVIDFVVLVLLLAKAQLQGMEAEEEEE